MNHTGMAISRGHPSPNRNTSPQYAQWRSTQARTMATSLVGDGWAGGWDGGGGGVAAIPTTPLTRDQTQPAHANQEPGTAGALKVQVHSNVPNRKRPLGKEAEGGGWAGRATTPGWRRMGVRGRGTGHRPRRQVPSSPVETRRAPSSRFAPDQVRRDPACPPVSRSNTEGAKLQLQPTRPPLADQGPNTAGARTVEVH